jgi:hypothetical protein
MFRMRFLDVLQESQILQMHWDISKLLSLGVEEDFLKESNLSASEARDLVKGLLYLRERYSRDDVEGHEQG